MTAINYSETIPNNVGLEQDRTLQRALEQWQPHFLQWWSEMGPLGSKEFDVYLRTAVSVDSQGWAQFGYVKMPEYRWESSLLHSMPSGASRLAMSAAPRPGKRSRASIARTCAGSSLPRVTPNRLRSSSSATSA
jgi:hypothetical protein